MEEKPISRRVRKIVKKCDKPSAGTTGAPRVIRRIVKKTNTAARVSLPASDVVRERTQRAASEPSGLKTSESISPRPVVNTESSETDNHLSLQSVVQSISDLDEKYSKVSNPKVTHPTSDELFLNYTKVSPEQTSSVDSKVPVPVSQIEREDTSSNANINLTVINEVQLTTDVSLKDKTEPISEQTPSEEKDSTETTDMVPVTSEQTLSEEKDSTEATGGVPVFSEPAMAELPPEKDPVEIGYPTESRSSNNSDTNPTSSHTNTSSDNNNIDQVICSPRIELINEPTLSKEKYSSTTESAVTLNTCTDVVTETISPESKSPSNDNNNNNNNNNSPDQLINEVELTTEQVYKTEPTIQLTLTKISEKNKVSETNEPKLILKDVDAANSASRHQHNNNNYEVITSSVKQLVQIEDTERPINIIEEESSSLMSKSEDHPKITNHKEFSQIIESVNVNNKHNGSIKRISFQSESSVEKQSSNLRKETVESNNSNSAVQSVLRKGSRIYDLSQETLEWKRRESEITKLKEIPLKLEKRTKSLGDIPRLSGDQNKRQGSQHLLVPIVGMNIIRDSNCTESSTPRSIQRNDSIFMKDAAHTPRLLQESLKNSVTLTDIPEFFIESDGCMSSSGSSRCTTPEQISLNRNSMSGILASVVGMRTPRSESNNNPKSRKKHPALRSSKSMAPSFFSSFSLRGSAAMSVNKAMGHSATQMESIKFSLEGTVENSSYLRISLTSELFEYAVGCGFLDRLSSVGCTDIKLYSSCITDPAQFESMTAAVNGRHSPGGDDDDLDFSNYSKNISFEYTNSVISVDCIQPMINLINNLEEPLASINLTNLKIQTPDGPVPFSHWGFLFSQLTVSCESLILSNNDISASNLQYLALYIARTCSITSVELLNCVDVCKHKDGLRWLHDCVAHRIIENETELELYLKVDGISYTEHWSELQYAVIRNDPTAASELMSQRHISLESRDTFGRTVLHMAAASGSVDCLRVLIEYLQNKTNIEIHPLLDYEDENGLTALEYAASRCYEECAKILIEAGAKVGAPVLESSLSLLVDHQDCVEQSFIDALQDHRSCAKSKRLAKAQLTLISSHAHGPLRKVALNAFLPGFLLYVCFLLLITYAASTISTNFDSTDFISTKTLKGKMEGREDTIFPKQDNAILISDVNRIPEIYDWADSVMLPVIREANQDESCDVVGAVRLRQVRVIPLPSFCDDDLTENKECWMYRSFNTETEDRSEFQKGSKSFFWKQTNEPVTLESELGHNYGSDGYFELIGSADINNASNQINHLRDINWIDDATRAVFVDLTFYKKNTARFIACHTVFELPPSGGIVVSMELVSIATWREDSGILVLLLSLSAVVLVADEVKDLIEERRTWHHQQLIRQEQKSHSNTLDPEVTNLGKQLLRILGRAKKHILNSWNAVDLIMIFLLSAVVVDCSYLPELDAVLFTDDTVYTSFSTSSARTTRLRDTFGLLVATGWAKSLKYMVHLPVAGATVNAVIATLVNIKILTFMMLFIVVSMSLSLGLHFTLGNTIQEFSTFTEAGLAFFRMVFGDFDVTSFTAHTSIVGELLFVTCLVTSNFMLMTILIAVIDIEYESQLEQSSLTWQSQMVDAYVKSMRADSERQPSAVMGGDDVSDRMLTPPRVHYIIQNSVPEAVETEYGSVRAQSVLSSPNRSRWGPLSPLSVFPRESLVQSTQSLRRFSNYPKSRRCFDTSVDVLAQTAVNNSLPRVSTESTTTIQRDELSQQLSEYHNQTTSQIQSLTETLHLLVGEVASLKNNQNNKSPKQTTLNQNLNSAFTPTVVENLIADDWERVQSNLRNGSRLETWSAFSGGEAGQ